MENDLIHRNALVEVLEKIRTALDQRDEGLAAKIMQIHIQFIEGIPAVDAVEVVRCKDCKYRDPENHHCDHATGTMIYFPRKPDDFCSYGERRADE